MEARNGSSLRSEGITHRWVNPNGGHWDDASNWLDGLLPHAGARVLIDVPGGATIIHRRGETSVASLRVRNRFVLSGGTLTANEIEFGASMIVEGGEAPGLGARLRGASIRSRESGVLTVRGTRAQYAVLEGLELHCPATFANLSVGLANGLTVNDSLLLSGGTRVVALESLRIGGSGTIWMDTAAPLLESLRGARWDLGDELAVRSLARHPSRSLDSPTESLEVGQPYSNCALDYSIEVTDPATCLPSSLSTDQCLRITTACTGRILSTLAKRTNPASPEDARGVVVIASGGNGNYWFEDGFFSNDIIDHLLERNYIVVQLAWEGPWGWFENPDPVLDPNGGLASPQMLRVGCNPYNAFHAVREAIFEPLTNPDKKYFAFGVSSGTLQISLASLSCDFAFDGAAFIGGIVYRLDYACIQGTDGSTAPGSAGPHLLDGLGQAAIQVRRMIASPGGPLLDGSLCEFSNSNPRGNRGPNEQIDADVGLHPYGGTSLVDRAFGDPVVSGLGGGRCSQGAMSQGRSLYNNSFARLLETNDFGYPIYCGVGERDTFGTPYQAYWMHQDPNFNAGNGFVWFDCIAGSPHNLNLSDLGAEWIKLVFDDLDTRHGLNWHDR